MELASEIGRTDGVGAGMQRREHHRAHSTLACDIHATVTALTKAGD